MSAIGPGAQRRLVRALADSGVEFVLIGGLAVSAHGFERATRDVDVVFSTQLESCRNLASTLSELAAVVEFADVPPPQGGISPDWLAAGGHFRFATDAGPLDALSRVGSMDYAALVAGAIEVELSGSVVRVCSYSDLVTMKRATGRKRDEYDLEALEAARADEAGETS